MSAHELQHVFPHLIIDHVQSFREGMSLWTVLVVDDNPAVRKLICELFTSESDFEVCAEAENGSEALLKAQQFDPDLVVTDLSMPQMNGLEEIRALNKLRLTTPVILYSAHIDSFVEKEAFARRGLRSCPEDRT